MAPYKYRFTQVSVKPYFSYFTTRETAPGFCMKDYNPGASMDDLEKEKITCPFFNKLRF
jgi:hypothetical protein